MCQVKNFWQFSLVWFVLLFCSVSPVVMADNHQASFAQIRAAVFQLVDGEPASKQASIDFLEKQGVAAISYYVQIMQETQDNNSFVGLELLKFTEAFGEAALPVIEQGLKDSNPATRKRAARNAFTLGEKAADLADSLALVVANNQEETDIRIQAADALRAINTVNDQVKKGIALGFGGDTMLSWRLSQVISHLQLTNDQLLAALLEELATGDNTKQALTAISRIINQTASALDQLEMAFPKLPDEIKVELLAIIGDYYSAATAAKERIAQFLVETVKNGSHFIQQQTLYLLGEKAKDEPLITSVLLNLQKVKGFSQEIKNEIYYALEKSEPDNQETISLFIELLTDPSSDVEQQLIAARYLEKCKAVPYASLLLVFDKLGQFSEEVLWRLSPMFYHAAKDNPAVIEQISKLDNQEYAGRILRALGHLDPLEIDYAAEKYERVPAFPGAEGYGRYTVGGRGGKVYVVTNLNDNGPGSLRAAVNASGPRTVVFAVSGNIMLKEPLDITNPYITIAGQTAPGDGITVAGAPVNIRADQVIIRYLRFRMGDYNTFEADTIGGRDISDVILDHISASWSTDECVSFYLTNNLTVQWSFITESLRSSVHVKGNHGYGGIWGGFSSFHHNLLAHHSSRNPRFDAERTVDEPATDMRNNVIYNWGFNSTYGGEGGNHNMIANYYKPGPATGKGAVHHRILDLSNGGRWYIADNYVEGYPEISKNNWAGGVQIRVGVYSEVKQDQPFDVPYVTTHTAEEAYELVLAHAGATLPARDSIDQRIVEEVRTGTATYGGSYGAKTGIIDSQEDVGGLVFLRSYSAPLDSDGDGIPDWWMIKYGFNPINGLDHAGDLDGDGYTNLEEYLNGTNPLKADQH